MFGQTINVDYIVKISSWENDADDYPYTVISGLTKNKSNGFKVFIYKYFYDVYNIHSNNSLMV